VNDLDAFAVMGWFATPLVTFQDAVQRTFDQSRPKGDIQARRAVDLVQAYASFDAHRNFGPLVDAFDAEDEQRRYATEDDVLIRMKDDVNIAAIVIRPKTSSKPLPTLLEYTTYITPASQGRLPLMAMPEWLLMHAEEARAPVLRFPFSMMVTMYGRSSAG